MIAEEVLYWADGRGEAVSGAAVVTAQVQGEKKRCGGHGVVEEEADSQVPLGTPHQPLMPSLKGLAEE